MAGEAESRGGGLPPSPESEGAREEVRRGEAAAEGEGKRG